MAWLLDPNVNPGVALLAGDALRRTVADHHRSHGAAADAESALAALAGASAAARWVRRERKIDVGRLDVEAEFVGGVGPVRLLIENKIDSAEGHRQLGRYARSVRGEVGNTTRVLPVLWAIGDQPPVRSSCADALVLRRADARRWLLDLADGLATAHGGVTVLVNGYLDAFDLWDLGARLRATHWREIELARRSPPDGWTLVADRLVDVDGGFCREVLADPAFISCLARHDLRTHVFRSTLNRAQRVNFKHASWQLRQPEFQVAGFEVHYEMADRGELFVHVEISPYEGGLDRKPGRAAALREPLGSKRRVLETLRARLLSLPAAVLAPSVKGLGDPARAGTLAAVRFSSAAAATTPPACAAFFVEAVDHSVAILHEEVQSERRCLAAAAATVTR